MTICLPQDMLFLHNHKLSDLYNLGCELSYYFEKLRRTKQADARIASEQKIRGLRIAAETGITQHSTAQTGLTARPWVHASRVKAHAWGQQHAVFVHNSSRVSGS